jgi:hypothetical protein
MTNPSGPRQWCLRKTALVINHQPVGRFTDQIEVIELSAYKFLQAELAETKLAMTTGDRNWIGLNNRIKDLEAKAKKLAEALMSTVKEIEVHDCPKFSSCRICGKLTSARDALKEWES